MITKKRKIDWMTISVLVIWLVACFSVGCLEFKEDVEQAGKVQQ
jgi:hypothetical protein